MNPVIVIPTYWTDAAHTQVSFDHATLVDAPSSESPELARCLDSLEKVRGIIRTCILVTAPSEVEEKARACVERIVEAHPALSPVVIGSPELALLREAMDKAAPTLPGDCVALNGYGALRNVGLAVAAVLGHDVVVFVDDDEVILDETFLVDAVYGLGQLTRQGEPIVVKSGFFLNAEDSCYANPDVAWYDKAWNKHAEFNRWMQNAMSSTRISRSNHVCGGCMAVHAEAYFRVAFDPYITRGEDLDYLINMRFYGLDVWFDNRWRLKHLPPKTAVPSERFLQNVYRWIYERAKLQFSASIIGFNRVTPSSLMPYPGLWVSPSIDERARITALRRAVGTPEHKAYFEIWRHGIEDARENAERTKASYLAFQTWWPSLMEELWDSRKLALSILASGIPQKIREQVTPDSTAVLLETMEDQGNLWDESSADQTIAQRDVDQEVPGAVGSAVEPVASTVSEEVDSELIFAEASEPEPLESLNADPSTSEPLPSEPQASEESNSEESDSAESHPEEPHPEELAPEPSVSDQDENEGVS